MINYSIRILRGKDTHWNSISKNIFIPDSVNQQVQYYKIQLKSSFMEVEKFSFVGSTSKYKITGKL